MTVGVLLLNLGTPESLSKRAIRGYLREFLMDPRVITLPFFLRFCLVYGLIAPFRATKVLEAYRKVWDPGRGSPLRYHLDDLTSKVGQELGKGYRVVGAMRYGTPGWQVALDQLLSADIDELIVVPLFPQYASATTGSVLDKVLSACAKRAYIPSIRVLSDYYDHPAYIAALKASLTVDAADYDHVLMSFHGLPVKDVDALYGKACNQNQACPPVSKKNRQCYRAQCYQTARALAKALSLAPSDYTVSFQSRLGKLPWIKPYTDKVLEQLSMDGHKKLLVLSPSFITDCLETLEELSIQGAKQWHELTQGEMTVMPCLNSDPTWVRALSSLIKQGTNTISVKTID